MIVVVVVVMVMVVFVTMIVVAPRMVLVTRHSAPYDVMRGRE